MHHLIQKFLKGESREELINEYLLNFRERVVGKAPNSTVFSNYFTQGITYLQTIEFPFVKKVLAVEKEVGFSLDGRDFIGFIDLVAEDADGRLIIMDHKSRALKPRSKRKSPTKSDAELDEYLKQLYFYSIPVAEEYGRPPDLLMFNCFRIGEQISEPFNPDVFEKTKEWALDEIKKIQATEKWKPRLNEFACRHICDFREHCEYFEMLRK
jgi:RecB family exonuclease